MVALYLLAAVELTSLARRRLPRSLWRKVHYASFPLFVSATVHGLLAGTDARLMFVKMLAISVVLAFVVAVVVRVTQARAERRTYGRAASSTTGQRVRV